MNEEELNKLIRHNKNLVRTAAGLRDDLRAAHVAMLVVIDSAEPIAEQYADEPSEYIVPFENVEDMREVLVKHQKRAA